MFRKITDPSDKYTVYVESKNVIMRSGDDTQDIITKIYETFLDNYEEEENNLRYGSNFVYDSVDLSLVKFYKIKTKRGGSYISTPKWVSDQKATVNPKNTKDDCCFAYSIISALHDDELDHHPRRITKLAPYIKNYNLNDIGFPTEQKDWKIFESNGPNVALNILSAHSTKKKLNIIRRSDYNHTRKHQVILLMISNNKNNHHYITGKCLSRLSRGITSNNNGDDYCLNCLHAYRRKNALIRHELKCNNHDYCKPLMPEKGKNILKYKHDKKSLAIPHVIYADLECLLRLIESCKQNPSDSYTLKKNVRIPSGYALHLVRSYDQNLITENRGTDCMQKFVRAIKTMTMMIVNTKEKRPIRLTKEEMYSYNRRKYCHICKKRFSKEESNNNNHKVRDYCYYTGKYRGAAHRKCSKDNSEEREIPIVFHNGSTYDYRFIIKEIAKNVDGIECLAENSEKYISFKALLNKEDEDDKLVTYKLKFIDSIRFMKDSLQNLTDNLSELNKCNKCNRECDNYKRHNDILIYRCKECNSRSYKSLGLFKNRFSNVYTICNDDLDKCLLLLRKGVYPYEYMDKWNRFNETTLPNKEMFCSELNQQHITEVDYKHAQLVWDTFNIKNLGEYHDLYVQSDTLQLDDVFENFRKTFIDVYELDPPRFVSALV